MAGRRGGEFTNFPFVSGPAFLLLGLLFGVGWRSGVLAFRVCISALFGVLAF